MTNVTDKIIKSDGNLVGMSLSELFAKSLSSASKFSNLPTVESGTQVCHSILSSVSVLPCLKELIRSCLKDLKTMQSRLAALSVFSPNESLEDIGTKDLVYLFVPYVQSELLDRVKTTGITERLQVLEQAQVREFVPTS